MVFWEQGFGDDPANASGEEYETDIIQLLNVTENAYVHYRETLQFVEPVVSVIEKSGGRF